jgi:predicted nucleic acid-binding protein
VSVPRPFGPGVPLVLDSSAWVRQREAAVRDRWIATLEADLLVVCPVVALELLASSRNDADFARLDATLSAFRRAPVTAGACEAAMGASRELGGRRRIPAADYLIAAAAAERGFGVLHCDKHFDVLCGSLGIESVWAA